LAISPERRLWATWYAGKTPKEDANNYVVVAMSDDNGKSWNESRYVDPDGEGPVRAFDPQIWIDPKGRLWSFWAQAIGHDATVGGVWAMVCENPDAADPRWSKPERLTDGVMMGKPLVLSTGEWVLPASTWRKTDRSARMVVSRNGGKSWRVRGACHIPKEVRNFDEHMIIERKDGSLWMLVRTTYGIGESISEDHGATWSPLEPSEIAHPAARFFIRRLDSGNLLLVKHGPMEERTGRSHLTAYLSEDDGESWRGGLLLDERNGVSYPDGQQDRDGRIYIIYDYSRTGAMAILMANFLEDDILSGEALAPSVSLRNVVSSRAAGDDESSPRPEK
jgi:predicted neuraminidase